MALDTFAPPYDPSPGTSTKPRLKLLSVDFGDGYTQEMPDGINFLKREVSLTWEALTIVQAAALETFMEGKGGYIPFLYALSNDTVRQWKCKDWSRKRQNPDSFTATFIEDFSLWP
jgi:phage-related protein